jgi:hypothetical protein
MECCEPFKQFQTPLGDMAIVFSAAAQTMLERLDPPTRASVLMALLGLMILGFGLMLLAWLGARFTRRYRKGRAPARSREGVPQRQEDAWWKKPVSGDLHTPPRDDENG